MSNELTVTGQWSDSQKTIMKKTICNGLTDDEMAVFGHLCKHYNLDPFSKQIYAMKTGGKLATITGIDGLRLIAERTKCYAPGRDTEFLYQDNQLIGAKVYVKKRTEDGTWHEVSATAFMKEYAKQTSIWKSLAHVMIEKCAESRVLRRCFPAQMSGLYTAEEMPERDVEITTVPSISFEETEMLEKRLEKFPEYKEQLLRRCTSLFGSPSFERLTREMFNNVIKKLEEMEHENEINQSVA